MDALQREKLETLDGSRRGAKDRAAVRRKDLAAIFSMSPMTASRAVEGVTVDQFNALFAEVKAIRAALDQIAGAVK